jgi:lipid-binding SYLF domain-containing protein
MLRIPKYLLAAAGATALFLGGCSTAPQTSQDRAQLQNDSDAAINDLKSEDGSLNNVLNHSYGYAIFPSIGKGAVGVGGAYGQGEVYANGKLIGYVDMTQATAGAAIGGETYAELVVFQTGDALQRFESGQLTFEADASAVAVKDGAATNARWENGIAIFTDVKGGLMTDAAIGGQKFNFNSIPQ